MTDETVAAGAAGAATSAAATDDEILVAVSDFLDGVGAQAWREDIAAKIESEPAWRQVHADMVETRKTADALSGLQKARAPATFADDVTKTIHKRSAGRFFAKKTFGDRVPFGVLAVLAVLAICAIGYLMWASQTGSLKSAPDHAAHPGSSAPLLRP